MQRGGLYLLLFGLILLALSAAFAMNLFFESRTDLFEVDSPGPKAYTPESPERDSGWIGRMQGQKKPQNYYPAEEIVLAWDLVDADKKRQTLYKVSFESLDRYQYFCLIQVLNTHKIKRSIHKEGERYTIYLSLYSPHAANVLVEELKGYDIYATVAPYKSEINYTP